MIPTGLADQRRAQFVTRIAAAVKQQADFAARCDSVLRVSDEIEVCEEQIVVHHEPAAPLDWSAIQPAGARRAINDIWWFTWTVVRALRAAGPGTPHGGIQAGALYLDEAGRAKLGDFGIAPAYEAVCGVEGRRQLHCDGEVRAGADGRRCSGVWALLGEDEAREHGWLVPYFAHELLEGAPRLNPKADQFAAGVLLYLLATGTHPYGASFGDPALLLYFHLEPFALSEERPDWAEIFERQRGGVSTSADASVLGWAALVTRLLASDPGERFASAADAEQVAAEHCPAEWGAAAKALEAAIRLLDAGEAEAFLEQAGAWQAAPALPALWREQLTRWIREVEGRKQEIGAQKRLRQRLAEGQRALEAVEVERARQIGREVLAAPQCDEGLRAAAQELLRFCDEQDQFILSGADELAKVYLQSARQYIDGREFDHARQVLNGLLGDPATPQARRAQARRLRVEVELREQRIEQQLAELAGARGDLEAGRFAAARRRVEALLAEPDLPETTGERARELRQDIEHAQAQHATYAALLEQARAAWEQADLEAVERHLAEVPAAYAIPDVARARAELAARCAPLRRALECRTAAERALKADDPAAALAQAEEGAALEGLPELLRAAFAKLGADCRALIAERQQARLARLREVLEAAESVCAELRVEECRRLLDGLEQETGLPPDITAQARKVLGVCERVEQALKLFEHARRHVADRDFDAAAALLEGLRTDGLPQALLAERGRVRAEVERGRQEHARQQRERLAALLDEVDAQTAAGRLDEAEAALSAAECSAYLTEALRRRAAAARTTIGEQRQVLAAIAGAEAALAAAAPNPDEALRLLAGLPSELASWAQARAAGVRERATALAEQRRRDAIRRTVAALDAAQAALDTTDVTGARRHLEDARPGLELDATLAERHRQLGQLAAAVEQWMPKVGAIAPMVEAGEYQAARRAIAELLGEQRLPEPCRRRLIELRGRVEASISSRQEEIDAELDSLSEVLARRGRRARQLPAQLEALKADPLATERQAARAEALLQQYLRLPEPKPARLPVIAAASAALVALAALGLYLGGVMGGSGGGRPAQASGGSVAGAGSADAADTSVVEPPRPATPSTPVVEPPPEPPAVAAPASAVAEAPVQPPEPPRPTPEECWATYLVELRAALPEVVVDELLRPAAEGGYVVAARWKDCELLPFSFVRFDEERGVLEPPPAAVAPYFRLQAEALSALGQPLEIAMPADDESGEYAVRLEVRGFPARVAIRGVDMGAGTVALRAPVRLAGDTRADAEFVLEGRFADGRLAAGAGAGTAFAGYLRELRKQRMVEAIMRIGSELGLPPGVLLRASESFDGGPHATLSVCDASGRVWATVQVRWNRAALGYETDIAAALEAVREGLRAVAQAEETRDALARSWPQFRSLLRPPAGRDGSGYFDRCELLQLAVAEGRDAGAFGVQVDVTVGPSAAPGERITFPARLKLADGGLVWDRSAVAGAQAAISVQLEALSGAEELRARRAAEAARELAAELGVEADAIDVRADGEKLLGEVAVGGRRRFTWVWDRSELRYAERAESAPQAETLDEKLERLAARPAVEPGEFRDVLAEVAQAKIGRYGTPGYALAAGFDGAATAEGALLAVSAALQKLLAPVATRDPYPTVFVEYLVGERAVYGLSWRAVTSETDAISAAEGMSVWKVMPVEELGAYTTPAAFREAYSTDAALGERLMGGALGGTLRGSARAGGGAFGVVVAPDGALWLTRWEQVRFEPRAVANIDDRGAGAVAQAGSLRELLRPTRMKDGERHRRVGLWCVPTLAGEWRGPPGRIDDFQLGELISGQGASRASFRWRRGPLCFACVTDATVRGTDWKWPEFARSVAPEEIGYRFWERGWRNGEERWDPTPFASLVVIQLP